MKIERPILFSTDMVQALLDGRKTVTRREIKNMPDGVTDADVQRMVSGYHQEHGSRFCPYGKKGDLLYVRETWMPINGGIEFKASCNDLMLDNLKGSGEVWKPGIHLKKGHSRIWLEVTKVSVERLRTITEPEAIAEGIPVVNDTAEFGPLYKNYRKGYFTTQFPTFSFQTLWESINGKESWAADPYVWVVEFKVLSTTGKPPIESKSKRFVCFF